MNLILTSYLKGLIVTVIILTVSIGSTFMIDEYSIYIPQNRFHHELIDTQGDVDGSDIDIIKYGSYKQGNKVVLYLEVVGSINKSYSYQLFVVAKYPNEDVAHIYFNDVKDGIEDNYQSEVFINDNRIEVHFQIKLFVYDSYMIGIEARTLSFASEDTTASARDNSLETKFLGIL